MQKFIVTAEGRFRMGDVSMHRDLLQRGESCIGGGVYEWGMANTQLWLSGKSYDYGRVKWGCIDQLILPPYLEGISIYYEDIPLADFIPLTYKEPKPF